MPASLVVSLPSVVLPAFSAGYSPAVCSVVGCSLVAAGSVVSTVAGCSVATGSSDICC